MVVTNWCHSTVPVMALCVGCTLCVLAGHVCVAWPSARLWGHLCPNPPPQPHPAGWGMAPAPQDLDCWGAGWLPHGVKEQERVGWCCRNALWTWLLVTGENHKVREVVKPICEKLGFTPNLGIEGGVLPFFPADQRGELTCFLFTATLLSAPQCTLSVILKEGWETWTSFVLCLWPSQL